MSGAGSNGNASREWPPRLLVWAALALAVLAVYAPVRSFPFVVYDDKAYVSENPAVLGGLSREGVIWAFTHSEQGNYVPLTWLSHMLDVELFGLDAGRHHTVNALLHLLTALLLFEALRRMTGAPAPSAFVALLFAVHPTHVESVAWVAERRDTLSAFFWMLTLLAYAGYAGPGRRRGLRYAAVLAAFGLGLLAKPMLVTLPFVLLLLDFWPLRRASEGIGRLVLEKVPLLALAGLTSAAAVWTQGAVGAMATLEQLPLAARVANALLSYAAYLGKTLWPVDLAVFYPYALEMPLAKTAAALGLLVALSAAALLQWRSRPYLAVGWLWYLGTLLPVIGIVQIGSQSMADRYTYLPTIGIAIAIAWGAADLASGRPRARRALAAAAALALGACISAGPGPGLDVAGQRRALRARAFGNRRQPRGSREPRRGPRRRGQAGPGARALPGVAALVPRRAARAPAHGAASRQTRAVEPGRAALPRVGPPPPRGAGRAAGAGHPLPGQRSPGAGRRAARGGARPRPTERADALPPGRAGGSARRARGGGGPLQRGVLPRPGASR